MGIFLRGKIEIDSTDFINLKLFLFRNLLSPDPSLVAKCILIKDMFARFYRAPTSIFIKLEKTHFLKEAENALQETQGKFPEPNEFEEITAAINDLMQIGGENLLAGRLFDKR